MTEFAYSDLLPTGPDTTEYRLVTTEGVSTFEAEGQTFLKVDPSAIQTLTREAMFDIAHYLRTEHLEQLASILDDPEASPNDTFVATELLRNANIAAAGVLPRKGHDRRRPGPLEPQQRSRFLPDGRVGLYRQAVPRAQALRFNR